MSNELKFIASASSSFSNTHSYLPEDAISLFLTIPSNSFQFEKAAVFVVPFTESLNSNWSTVDVFPVVDMYLYLVLNLTICWDTSCPILCGSGIAQNPLTLKLGETLEISQMHK